MIKVDRRVEADGQVRTWMLSSSGAPHRGQLESNLCFLLTITFPVLMSLAINFEINLRRPKRQEDLLTLKQFQSIKELKASLETLK